MRILITGGSGFIGRNLFEYLSKRYDCSVPAHSELELLDAEAVAHYLQANRFDAVIHSAGIPVSRKIKEPKNVALGNLKMFFNIARNTDCFSKMIFFGSGAEYDLSRGISRVKESDSDRNIPADELGFSKYICSKYIEKGDNMASLRLFGVFGKYEDYQIRFISNAICKAVCGLPITIKQNRYFSYLYIDDLCKITEYFINHHARHKIYNVVPSETIDLLSIAKKVNRLSKKNLDIIVHTPGLAKEYTADNSLLMDEMGGFNFMPLEEAIKKLYGWYGENKKIINPGLLAYDP
jgi:GDP-L-fucose synthase